MSENFIPPFASVLYKKVLREDVSGDDFYKAAHALCEGFIKNNDIVGTYIKMCKAMDIVKVETIGVDGSTDRMNVLINMIADLVSMKVSQCEQVSQSIESITSTLHPVQNQMDKWLYPKYKILQTSLQDVISMENWLKGRDMVSLTKVADEFGHVRDIKESVDHLFTELLVKQTYGIKPSSFEDPFACPGNNSIFWNFTPADYLYLYSSGGIEPRFMKQAGIFSKVTKSAQMASIILSNKRQVDISHEESSYELIGGKKAVTIAIEAYSTFRVGKNGHLYQGFNNRHSIEEIAKKLNLGFVYDLLRMNVIARLYDLVVPVKIISELPRLPHVKKVMGIPTSVSGSLHPTLILKRIRKIFDDRIIVQEEFEREVEKATESPEKVSAKVEREVIWYTRSLPKGYKASAEAKTRAREVLQRELEPGETFVKGYTKNKGGIKPDQLHKVKRVR